MIALGMLSLLLLLVTSAALLALNHIVNVGQRTARFEARVSQRANDVAVSALLCRRYEKDFLLNMTDPVQRGSAFNAWSAADARIEQAILAFSAAATSDEDRRRILLWRAALQFYRDGFQQLAEGVQRGQITTYPEAMLLFRPAGENITTLTDLAMEASESKRRLAEAAGSDLERLSEQVIWALVAIGAAALAIALGWSFAFPRRLIRPILVLREAAMRLAGGELAARAEIVGDDELGELAARFNQMAETIQQRTGDLEVQYEKAEGARLDAEASKARIVDQLAMIKSQQALIGHLSVPILPLSETTLVVPLVGELDSMRMTLAQERVLHALERSAAHFLILDITAVPVVDTQVADGLIRMVRATELLGAHAVLVGIRPEVAQSLVTIGVDLARISTQRSLQSGIAYTNARTRAQASRTGDARGHRSRGATRTGP